MSEQQSLRLTNFIPLSKLNFKLEEDDDTGVRHLYLSGLAHGYKRNLKNIKIRQGAAQKAARRFAREQDAGRIHQVWIDHAYINPFGTSTPTEKVVGHVDKIDPSDEGQNFDMDINPDHPSQIHLAILRRDIDGISIGADVKHEWLYCSVDGKQMFSGDCEHYPGQKLDGGRVVLMEVDDYILDELTVTAKQADPEGRVAFSQLNDVDATLTFSLDTYDEKGKLIRKGVEVIKSSSDETFKNPEKQIKVDRDMTKEADSEQETPQVTSDAFNQLKDIVQSMATSSKESSDRFDKYLQAQEQRETAMLEAEKKEKIDVLLKSTDAFNEEDLLAFSNSHLDKLIKAFKTSAKGNKDSNNSGFGAAKVVQTEDELGEDKMELTRDDIKAWMRLKMGYKTPQAPKHIQRKVRARLNGDINQSDDAFLQYMLDKEKE